MSWPTSNAAWVQWLDAHDDTWQEAIRAVKAGVRTAVNQRIVPHADVPQKDPSVRLQPRAKDVLPSWAGKVADGWHDLSLKGGRIVIFAVRTAGRVAAVATALTLTVMRCGFHGCMHRLCVSTALSAMQMLAAMLALPAYTPRSLPKLRASALQWQVYPRWHRAGCIG